LACSFFFPIFCVHGTQEVFFDFLAGKSPVQPLIVFKMHFYKSVHISIAVEMPFYIL
jgi:hypothetical protein